MPTRLAPHGTPFGAPAGEVTIQSASTSIPFEALATIRTGTLVPFESASQAPVQAPSKGGRPLPGLLRPGRRRRFATTVNLGRVVWLVPALEALAVEPIYEPAQWVPIPVRPAPVRKKVEKPRPVKYYIKKQTAVVACAFTGEARGLTAEFFPVAGAGVLTGLRFCKGMAGEPIVISGASMVNKLDDDELLLLMR